MGWMITLWLSILALLGGALAKILAEEFRSWAPTLSKMIASFAVLRLGSDDRARYSEEWQAHLDEIPGDLSRIFVALGFVYASLQMSGATSQVRRSSHLFLKRVLDLAVSALAMVVLLPFFLLIALAIKLENSGPVISTHVTWGKGGKKIRVFKFRSIRMDLNENSCAAQDLGDDPGVTRVGAFMRKTNIDELPQLFNVLKGDMSLVGPRCHEPGMLAAGRPYEDLVEDYHLRHLVRPGLTGLAQTKGFRGSTIQEDLARGRIIHDMMYIENFSIGMDIRILAETLLQEIRSGKGF